MTGVQSPGPQEGGGRELTPLGYRLTSTHAVAYSRTHTKGTSEVQGRILVLLASKGKKGLSEAKTGAWGLDRR